METPDTGNLEPPVDVQPTGAPDELAALTALVPVGPEDSGLSFTYESLTAEKARVWNHQEAFLADYRQHGQLGKAAKAIGMTRFVQDKWLINDQLGWRERIKAAHADYCEDKIESKIQERLDNPEGNRGSDILLMFQAKAEMPEKYREEVKIIDTGPTKDLLAELRRLGQAKVVEGSLVPPPTEASTVEPEGTEGA